MPPSNAWKSDGAKGNTSDVFEVDLGGTKTKYTVKTDANITNGQVGASKLTLQDTAPGRNGDPQPRPLATSTDGGKTWIPEKDSEGKSIINSNQLAALYPGGKLYTAARNAAKIDAKLNGATDQQVSQLDKGNAAAAAAGITTSTSTDISEEQRKQFDEERATIKGNTRGKYDSVVVYPIGLDATLQDCIKFSIIEYKQSGLQGFAAGDENLRRIGVSDKIPKPLGKDRTVLSTIVLPIPGGIQDSNTVNWSGLDLPDLQQALGSVMATGIMGGDVPGEARSQAEAVAQPGSGARTSIVSSLMKGVLGDGGIMQRQFGTIVNPNLELLFNNPDLRTFNFSFKLSPRSANESVRVKKIIRYFKQAMSVKRSKTSMLLQTPHTFGISYIFQNKEHPYLNKFKECALTSCNVNYTPEGNYMAFDDSQNPSMVSYQLDLQFQELEPIYDDDYTASDSDSDTLIGY
jgi:hypothetical protein